MAQESEPIVVDARGHRCPTPTLRLQKALRGLPAGAEARLLADDPMARIDVPHFAQQNGHFVVSLEADGPVLVFVVRKGVDRP
jgi:tRNA 2-thiouridine synthesizing protein A